MHLIAQFLSFFSGGVCPPDRTSVNQHHNRANYSPGMQFSIQVKTFMNVDQIYSYLLKLKLNLNVGPNSYYKNTLYGRLAPVLKTIFHQCVISYTCSQSYSDGSVLKQSHQSKTGYKYMI